MENQFYQTGQFAKKASVSVRTLRYYDKVGLLSPTHHSNAGYRLYTDEDLSRLQYILALKFLGFSLDEVKLFLRSDSSKLQGILAKQKAMMYEKKNSLDNIIRAIEKTEHLLQTGQNDTDLIVKMIQVVQMNLKPEWMGKYLTNEQREYMRELVKTSYTKEDIQKFAAMGWTESDQNSFTEKYTKFKNELKRIVTEGLAPDSIDAQEAVKLLYEINQARSQGDPSILAGMKKAWENYTSASDTHKPMDYMISEEEREFLKKACIEYAKKHGK